MGFRSIVAGLLVLVQFPAGEAVCAGGGRYFPETGSAAIRQRTLDVSGGAVVMFVVLQPGYEDHALLSKLRMGEGARTVVVFATNGDATPNDLRGEPPQFTAARRKEEALAAVTLLGGQTLFLNLPDPGIVTDSSVLAGIWNADTVSVKLSRALRGYRPDVVILQGDLRAGTPASLRFRLLREFVLGAAGGASWRVPRVLTEAGYSAKGELVGLDELAPSWKLSYRKIGAEAAAQYATLRFAQKRWEARGYRTYRQILPSPAPVRGSLVRGFPLLSRRLKSLGQVIRTAVTVRGGGPPPMRGVAAAIDSVERVIAYQGNELSPGELRVVAGWKNGLEDLRCSLLGVSVSLELTDSLLTQTQLFTMRIRGVTAKVSAGGLKIIFPGAMEKKWGINESAQYKFDLSPPEEFRVITPKEMENNAPASQFGVMASILRTRFPFLIYHEDSIRARMYVYRGEVSLRAAPRRTFEILTPVIRSREGEPVVFRLTNVSRDAYRGTIAIEDSLVRRTAKPIALDRKDQVVTDTLLFSPLAGTLPQAFSIKVKLSGEGVSQSVLVKTFDVRTDTAARVGVITAIEGSPVVEALRRMGIAARVMAAEERPGQLPGDLTSIVLDREALSGMSDPDGWMKLLLLWVQGGGNLIVLPQMAHAGDLPSLPGFRFLSDPQGGAGEVLREDASSDLLREPNVLTDADWQGWVVSRSVGAVGRPTDAGSVLRGGSSGSTLLASMPEGGGRVTVVALDIVSQLLNVHPGAHRLLANLVRRVTYP